jgi:hypothetical protein
MRRLLIRLYPAAWRERYGAELEALMADAPGGWRADLDLLRGALGMRLRLQRAWAMVTMFVAAGAVAGLLVSYSVTPKWEARGVMQCTLATRSNEDHAQKLAAIQETLKSLASRQTLAAIITDPRMDLYRRERRAMLLDGVVDTMRRNIRILVSPEFKRPAVVFTIAFAYPDARKAVDTTNRLIGKFMADTVARGPAFGTGAVYYEVLDPPALPTKPMSPNRTSFAAAGGIIGLILALATLIVRRRNPPLPQPA